MTSEYNLELGWKKSDDKIEKEIYRKLSFKRTGPHNQQRDANGSI